MVGGVGVLFLLAGAFAMFESSGGRSAKAQLAVVDPHVEGESLVISVLTSNAGSSVLVNGGNFMVRYKMDGAWNTNSLPGLRSCIYWLLPGQTNSQRFKLPRGVSRFQVGAEYEAAHGRGAAACRLYSAPVPHWFSGALVNVLSVLPYRPGPYIEFWDDEHEVRNSAN
jgi:hypothetical protein